MNILAFDTCFDACSAAVLTDSHQTVSRFEPMRMGHAEALIPMILAVLTEAGLTPVQIDRIAVTRGPGTFTGTRIGLSAARAMCLATGSQGIGFSSLQVIAAANLNTASAKDILIVARPERRGTHDTQFFDCTGQPTGEPIAATPDQIVSQLVDQVAANSHARVVIAGAGADELASSIGKLNSQLVVEAVGLPASPQHTEPNAKLLLALASGDISHGSPALTPLYLRPADAKPSSKSPVARIGDASPSGGLQ